MSGNAVLFAVFEPLNLEGQDTLDDALDVLGASLSALLYLGNHDDFGFGSFHGRERGLSDPDELEARRVCSTYLHWLGRSRIRFGVGGEVMFLK